MKNFQDDLARQLSLALEKQFDFQVQLDADDETAQKIEHDINLLLREAQKARRVEDERRRVEEESRQLYWFLESIIENVPVMLFVKNAKDLTLELWNRRSEELTGIPREEILGKTGIESFPGEQMEAFNQRDREVLEGKRLVATEEPITTKNGDRWLYTKKFRSLTRKGSPNTSWASPKTSPCAARRRGSFGPPKTPQRPQIAPRAIFWPTSATNSEPPSP